MTNVWDAVLTTARDPEVDAGLLQETRRLMRLVEVSNRHADVAGSISAVVARKGTWEDVSTALAGHIYAALVALATLQEDPEKFFSDYLRPHPPNGQAWTWPHFADNAPVPGDAGAGDPMAPADLAMLAPCVGCGSREVRGGRPSHTDKCPQRPARTGMPHRAPADVQFVVSPQPAAAEPDDPAPAPGADAFRQQGLQVLGDPSPFFAVRPMQGLPENVQVVHHASAEEIVGGQPFPVQMDRFADLPPVANLWDALPLQVGQERISLVRVSGIDVTGHEIPPLHRPGPPLLQGPRPSDVQSGVRPLQQLAPGVHLAPVDPNHVDRDSA